MCSTTRVACYRLFCVLSLVPTLALAACDPKDDGVIDAQGDSEEELSEEELSEEEEEEASPEDDRRPPPPISTPITAIPCDPTQAWGGYACETDAGEAGTQQCIVIDDEEYWTPCEIEEPTCYAGDYEPGECVWMECVWNGEEFGWVEKWDEECDTPLVLNFERGPVEFAPVAAATFDLSTDSTCTNTAWPTAPWLALDRDGDGFIRSGAELFGNATAMRSGGFAQHGFAALAELDSNFDGKIDASDARFGDLVLWSDLDDDRIGAYAELRPLSESQVISIDLGFTRRATCDAMGNCGYERASFEYQHGESTRFGEVVDVHLLCQ